MTPEPFVLNLAPTGMVPTRELTPHAPLQPDEIVADVLRCAEAGITTVHIHARDTDGHPTHRADVYREIIAGIRQERPDLVIGVSCSGRSVSELEARAEVLDVDGDLKPDLASLTLSSLNFPGQASMNAPDVVRGLAERMQHRGITPELEVFDIGMANYAAYLVDKGVLTPPLYANVFVGNLATAHLRLLDLAAVVAALPPGTAWSLAGIGRAQNPATAVGIAMGGGVRTGLEDDIWADTGRTELGTNLGKVERIHELAGVDGRPLMSSAEFRRRFCRGAG
jgi:3-keto-5-aminohexanoate cleavage enzyme